MYGRSVGPSCCTINPALPFTHPHGALVTEQPWVVLKGRQQHELGGLAVLEEGDSPGTPQDREGAGAPKSPLGVGAGLQLRVLRPRSSRSEPHHPRSRALRGRLLPITAPPRSRNTPETPARPCSMKRRGQPGPHPELGAIPGAPSPHTLCQALQLLPGLGKAGPGKQRSGPHVLAANPPSRSNQIGPCWQTGL